MAAAGQVAAGEVAAGMPAGEGAARDAAMAAAVQPPLPFRHTPGYHALVLALGVWVAVMAAFVLHLPDPWWAGISAWMIGQAGQDRKAMLNKASMRFAGTIIGCILGFEVGGRLIGFGPLAVALVMSVVFWFATRKRFTSPHSYAWLVACLTFAMAILGAVGNPADLAPFVVARGMEITVGILGTTLVVLLLAPPARPPGPQNAVKAPPGSVQAMEIEHVAIISAVTAPAIIGLVVLLDLPSAMQIFVSSIAVTDRSLGTMQTKALQRLIGCVLGGVPGIVLALLLPGHLFPWSLALFTGMFLFTFLHQGDPKTSYFGTQAGIAFLMGLITGSGPPTSIGPVIERVIGIMLGVAILLLVTIVLKPLLAGRIRAGHHVVVETERA